MWADFLLPIGCFMLQDGVAWFHHSGNLWRNDGENVVQTSRIEMQGLFACMLFFFGVSSATLIFGVCFSLRLLACGDGDPSKPHLNLRGKHFLLLFCVICSCFWENCVPKIDLTRAIFSTLGDCFGTPLLRKSLLVSIHNYDWQTFQWWNCGIDIVIKWVLLFSSHTLWSKMAEINYIRSWCRASVRTRETFLCWELFRPSNILD